MRAISKLQYWLCGLLAVMLILSTGADHRDAPGLQTDPASDINDVYAFVDPTDNTKVVLAMTVNPFTAPGLNPVFSPNTLYQFKIDNNNDAVEDLVIQVTFDRPTGSAGNANQNFTMRGPAKPARVGQYNYLLPAVKTITGPIHNGDSNFTTDEESGISVFAGNRDDPFFFDFVYVIDLLSNVYSGSPRKVTREAGVDFFKGFNVSVIAIRVPSSLLTKGSDSTIRVWGTTNIASSVGRTVTPVAGLPLERESRTGTFVQFDRMGLPAINTALIGTEFKDNFNASIPSQDRSLYSKEMYNHIFKYTGGDAASSTTFTSLLLPDVLTLNTTSTAGFATLNGRQPGDDVIDIELNLLTKGGVKGDGVNSNDVPFLQSFPFFAPPHQATETITPRNLNNAP